MDELRPRTRVEEILVDKLAVTTLRLERCARMEAVWLEEAPKPFNECQPPPPVDVATLSRKQRNRHAAELREREEDKRLRRGSGAESTIELAGRWLDRLKLLQRYDTSLTNQFFKLLHELQDLQAARPAPAVSPQPPTEQAAAEDAPSPAEARALRNEPNPGPAEDAAATPAEEPVSPEAPILRNEPNPRPAETSRPANSRAPAPSAPTLQNGPNTA